MMPFGIGLHGFIFFDCSLFRRLNPPQLANERIELGLQGRVGKSCLSSGEPRLPLIPLCPFMQRGHAPGKGTLVLVQSLVDLYNVLIH
jgi:hypothetical protein